MRRQRDPYTRRSNRGPSASPGAHWAAMPEPDDEANRRHVQAVLAVSSGGFPVLRPIA